VVAEVVSASHLVRTDQLVQTLVAVCGPQDVLEKLPNEVMKNILGISYVFSCSHKTKTLAKLFFRNIQEALLAAVTWVGSENILHPLVRAFVSK